MGSTRLPGKVMKEILGHPMLWHIYNRLQGAKTLDDIVIATTINPLDKVIIEFAKENGIKYYRGSEMDIVDRMYMTAEKFGATALVRVTADCPLVDPEIVDMMVEAFSVGNYDYVSNWSPTQRTYPHGIEVEMYSFKCLRKLWIEVKDPLLREWIPFNIHDNSDQYNIKIIQNDSDLSVYRLTVDYEEDFLLVNKIYSELFKQNSVFSMVDILRLMEKNPELAKINEQYSEKKGVEGYVEQKGRKLV